MYAVVLVTILVTDGMAQKLVNFALSESLLKKNMHGNGLQVFWGHNFVWYPLVDGYGLAGPGIEYR
jgi:hypothetical protein